MAATATQTELLQLIVGMFDAAPGADLLASLETEYAALGSINALAANLMNTGVLKGIYPDSLDNNAFATAFITNLLSGEVDATNTAFAITWAEGQLNAGMSRSDVMVAAINAINAADANDTVWGGAQKALANQTAAAEYYSIDQATSSTDFAALQAVTASVTSDPTTVPADFTLEAGLATLTAANAAVATFNTDNPTTASDLTTAISDYDAAVTDSALATDSTGLAAAKLADQQTANATTLTNAQTALATANTAIAAVTGLTEAVAADTAADIVVTDTTAAAVITATAVLVADAAWDINALVDAKIDAAAIDGVGVITVVVDDGADEIFADDTVLTITEVDGDTGLISLVAATDSWTAEQVAFFATQQATAADLISAFNANVTADTAASAAGTAAAATQATVDFLDIDTDASDELALVGAGFTLTTVTTAATPTEAEIASEATALTAAATAAQVVVDGALVALNVAIADADIADADTNDEGTSASIIDTGSILVTRDGSGLITLVEAELDGASTQVDLITIATGTASFAAAVDLASYDAVLDVLLAAVQADLDANATNNDADAAETTFGGLVTDFATANNNNPLTSVLGAADPASGLLGDVANAETAITVLADAITALADANVQADALTALGDAATAAMTAITEAGYAAPEALDAANEFGTSADDLFVAGTVDSSIFNFGVIGGDTLYIGGETTYNNTLIGADDSAGETLLTEAGNVSALETFLVTNGSDVDVVIETKAYGSETGDYTTVKLVGVELADVTVADGFITIA